jgi:hypothetical protein
MTHRTLPLCPLPAPITHDNVRINPKLLPGLCVGDREAGADGKCGKLIDRIASGAPIRKLLFVEARRHMWVPFASGKNLTFGALASSLKSAETPAS